MHGMNTSKKATKMVCLSGTQSNHLIAITRLIKQIMKERIA